MTTGSASKSPLSGRSTAASVAALAPERGAAKRHHRYPQPTFPSQAPESADGPRPSE